MTLRRLVLPEFEFNERRSHHYNMALRDCQGPSQQQTLRMHISNLT